MLSMRQSTCLRLVGLPRIMPTYPGAPALQIAPPCCVKGKKRVAIFQSDQQFYAVLNSVFERLAANPANIDTFIHSNLVVRLNFVNPTAEILVDGRQPPLEVFYGPSPGKANLEVTMSADLLHAIWIGDESTSQSLFSGRIKTKGNLLRATQLLDLFREAERVYPAVAAEHGLIAA